MIKRKIIQEESAISPIIGTILMVAITVIMAAIISSWSSGIKAPATPTTVGLDIQRLNGTVVQLTVSSIDPPGVTISNITFYNKSATENSSNTSLIQEMSQTTVGSSKSVNVSGYNEFVVITVKLQDGTVKTVYSQRI